MHESVSTRRRNVRNLDVQKKRHIRAVANAGDLIQTEHSQAFSAIQTRPEESGVEFPHVFLHAAETLHAFRSKKMTSPLTRHTALKYLGGLVRMSTPHEDHLSLSKMFKSGGMSTPGTMYLTAPLLATRRTAAVLLHLTYFTQASSTIFFDIRVPSFYSLDHLASAD